MSDGICSKCLEQHKKVVSGSSRHINKIQKVNVILAQRNAKLVSAIRKGIQNKNIVSFDYLTEALVESGNPVIIENIIPEEKKEKTWQELRTEWGI